MASDTDDTGLREEIVANQAVIDGLNERLARKTDEVRIIQQISAEINSTLDLGRTLALVLDAMDAVLGFRHGMILLADPAAETLTLAASRGYEVDAIGAEVAVGQGVLGVVAKRRKMMRMGNIGAQMRYAHAVQAQLGTGDAADGPPPLPGLADVQSQIAIPLVVQDRLVGVFAVESERPNAFDELDEVLLSIVGNQVANAIDNARLHEEQTARARDLDQANAELSRLNETLESTVRERTAELSKALDDVRHEQQRSTQLLSHLAPPALIPAMLEDRLEPRRFMATILFADLEGFTSFTAGMEPDEIFARLNSFFSWAGERIRLFRGYLNKTNGDGIMAIWGVPDGSPTHAIDAVLAAVMLQREIAEHLPLGMRIGVDSGKITAGMLGPEDSSLYDALGETINAASRLERLSAAGTITIGPSTHELVAPYFSITPLGRQEVKGLEAVDCFRVDDMKPLLDDRRRIDPTSRFAREHAAALDEMVRVRDDVLDTVNFVSIQSRDGAIRHNGAVAAFALALLRLLRADADAETAAAAHAIDEDDLIRVALLHDVGKHAVDPATLNAPDLDAAARDDLCDALQAATEAALGRLGLDRLVPVVAPIYRFERSGGKDGPFDLMIEIVCAADIYDALTAPKIYKGASWRITGALEELLRLPCCEGGERPAIRGLVELMRPEGEVIAARRSAKVVLQ